MIDAPVCFKRQSRKELTDFKIISSQTGKINETYGRIDGRGVRQKFQKKNN